MPLKTKILLAISTLVILLGLALGYAISPTAEASLAIVFAGLAILAPVAIIWPVGGLFGALFIRHSLDAFVYKTINIPLLDISLNLAAGLSLAVLVACLIYFSTSQFKWSQLPLKNFWLFFLITITLSLPLSRDLFGSFQEWLKVIVSFCLFAVGASYFGLKNRREWIEKLILAALLIPMALALWQIITSSGLIGFGLPSRAFGTYYHPNSLAFNLVLGLGVLFYFWSTSLRHKKWPTAVLILGLTILIFTYSRAGLLSLLAMVLIIGFLEYPKLTIKIIMTGALIYLLFTPVNDYLKQTYRVNLQDNPLIARFTKVEEDYNSLDWRKNLWLQSVTKIKERPILGWGYGTYGDVLGAQGNEIDLPAAHNDYIRLWVETGSLGLLSYLALLAAMAFALFRRWLRYKHRSFQKLQFAVLLGILGAIIIQGMSDNILHTSTLQWSWLLLLGASLAEPWKQS